MQAIILQENLVKSLQLVSRFIPNKPVLPILSSVKIEASDNWLTFTGSNLETGVQTKTGAKVSEPGTVVVPVKLLLEYVQQLNAEKVTLTVKEGLLIIESSRRKAELATNDTNEYPQLPEFTETQKISFNVTDLASIVDLVSFAAANDDTRPVLTTTLFTLHTDGTADAVATDGYRLSWLQHFPVTGADKEKNILIVSKIIRELTKLAKEQNVETIDLKMAENGQTVKFEVGSSFIIGRVVDGDFPPFKKIIPSQTGVVVRCDRQELLDAVKASAIFSRDGNHIVSFESHDNVLSVKAQSASLGKQQSELEVSFENISEEQQLKIAFNSTYLIDLLSSLSDKQIDLHYHGTLQAAVFRIPNNDRFLHVIMPVRTQGA